MTSDSDTYIALQQVYKKKALEHIRDMQERITSINKSRQVIRVYSTVEPGLIATEMLAFPSKSSRNKNDSDPLDGKTTPI